MHDSADRPSWWQSNVAFSDWHAAERVAVTHLIPVLTSVEREGLITDWFLVRKNPYWRIRYLACPDTAPEVRNRLHALARSGPAERVTAVTHTVYEPEQHAFGGLDAMATAHQLFSNDTRHLQAYLSDIHLLQSTDRRTELAILLVTELLRAARLDWYEQGDVWARVADHRADTSPPFTKADSTHCAAMRRLIGADIKPLMTPQGTLKFAARWFNAYAAAGAALSEHHISGRLHRGLRAVLTHHVIFTFNRFGLPYAIQATIAQAAMTAVFGPDPSAPPMPSPIRSRHHAEEREADAISDHEPARTRLVPLDRPATPTRPATTPKTRRTAPPGDQQPPLPRQRRPSTQQSGTDRL
ncbi:thiopeptide-type bacteriocin biosynthesis protein [Actinomadura sp. 9N215]|uniref:thiopeptide-type bacteriocin biosynthesis protein n=1 Tax=Actinomadura sp. 9N215 TaxID=3375150 RepID=UPI0037A46283